jgi:hypothetical protein
VTAPQPSADLATRDDPFAAPAAAQQQPPAAPRPPVHLVGPQDDLEQAFRLAKALAMSTIIPDSLRGKPSDILVITLYGQELGLAPMQAIQVIDVVKGRPTLRANLWVALARRAGHKVRVPEATGEACTVTVIRHDDPDGPITARYTIEDAKQARLLSNTNYQTNPAAMLYARAASTAIRRACPEVAMGFSDEYELTAVDEPEVSPLLGVVPPAVPDAVAQAAGQAAGQASAPAATAPEVPEDLADEYADIAAEAGGLFATPPGGGQS